jgi:hypothetical protein
VAEVHNPIALDQIGLATALKSYQLVVPPNQREYAWEDTQVTQLLQDFAKALDEDAPYFLGTIVTIPRGSGELEVVDGQQRLATTALLLAAIRDYLRGQKEDMIVESINSDFLTGIDRERRERVPKLSLNIDDNELFGAVITNSDGFVPPSDLRPSNERLVNAYRLAERHVRNLVSPFDPNQHGDTLNRWVSFLEHQALVVLLRVPDDADAYKMFETLNDRGLRTSQVDLIKNYLFGRSGNRFNEVQTRWAYMRGALESLDEEDITINFLRHALVLTRGYLSAPDVYQAVQEIAKGEQATVKFATELELLAPVYVATFNPEHERWNAYPSSARRAIEVFNLLNIKPMRALLLAVAAKMKEKPAAESFAFLVALGVRLVIAATIRSGSVEVPLSTGAKEIWAGSIKTVAELKEHLKKLTPTDVQFMEAFERAKVSNTKLARYYLRSLETAHQDLAEPYFFPSPDETIINLEHVLPQKPMGNWPTFTDEEVPQYVKRLGNLVLMRASENSKVRSAGFEAKRALYAASPYELTSEVAVYDEWTPEALAARQSKLATLAVKTWPVV